VKIGRLFSFDGRVGREEWWLTFGGAVVIISAIDWLLLPVGGPPDSSDRSGQLARYVQGVGLILSVFTVLLLAGIALGVTAKRWHDRDQSGLWTLLALVPFIGWAWVASWVAVLPGTAEPNRYGFPDDGSVAGDSA